MASRHLRLTPDGAGTISGTKIADCVSLIEYPRLKNGPPPWTVSHLVEGAVAARDVAAFGDFTDIAAYQDYTEHQKKG
ncbi:hypothetical protein [Rhizobium mongolense]|uniref:hypothetical protein n=1 Tax=Rhizobium mongolense TaxID=57676 RepID=UPI0011140FFF|nr:hypothetical protein [Rhizobium mongolense]